MSDLPRKSSERQGYALAWTIVRVVTGFALLGLLFQFDALRLSDLTAAIADPEAMAAATLGALGTLAAATVRWAVLLRRQGVVIGVGQAAAINYISVFMNTFLPGAAGGDAVRLLYLLRQARGRRLHAVVSTLMDRIVGVYALLLLAGLALLFSAPDFRGNVAFATLSLTIFGILVTVALIVVVTKAGRRHLVRLNSLEVKSRLVGLLIDALNGFASYRASTMLLALLLSMIGHLAFLVGAVFLAAQIGPPDASGFDYGVATLVALAANAVPVSPGGLGVGEAAFDFVCRVLSGGSATAGFAGVFLAMRLAMVIASLPGFGVFILYRARSIATHDERDTAEA